MVLQYDADGDGELSRDERRLARDADRATLEAQFDVNRDGTLSEEERAGLDAIKKHRGRGGKKNRKAGHEHKGERNTDDATEQTTNY